MNRTLTAAEGEILALETLRASVGTVVWAHGIGDTGFEEHGRAMVSRFLDEARHLG